MGMYSAYIPKIEVCVSFYLTSCSEVVHLNRVLRYSIFDLLQLETNLLHFLAKQLEKSSTTSRHTLFFFALEKRCNYNLYQQRAHKA